MKRKQLLAVVVAGAAAVALAIPRASADTILPTIGERTVTQKRFLPQTGFAVATFDVTNLSGPSGPEVTVTCTLQRRLGAASPTASWSTLGEDKVSIGGPNGREATGSIEIEAPVRETGRFTLRVRCSSSAVGDEPTTVGIDPSGSPDALTIQSFK